MRRSGFIGLFRVRLAVLAAHPSSPDEHPLVPVCPSNPATRDNTTVNNPNCRVKSGRFGSVQIVANPFAPGRMTGGTSRTWRPRSATRPARLCARPDDRRHEQGGAGIEHLGVRPQVGRHDRPPRPQIGVDLQGRARAARPRGHQNVAGGQEGGNLVRRTLPGEDQRAAGRHRPPPRVLDLIPRAADDEDAGAGMGAAEHGRATSNSRSSPWQGSKVPVYSTTGWSGRRP